MATRKTPQPTMLGKVIRYLNDSITYGRGSARKSSNPLMLQIAQSAARTGSMQDSSDLEYYLRLAVTAPHFFAAAQTVAERVAESADLVIEQQVGDRWEKMPAHKFMYVLDHPNPIMTGGLLLNSTAWDMQCLGNSYWFLVTDRPGVGPVREIWPLPSLKVRPNPMTLRVSPITGKLVIDYEYTLGTIVSLPGENVLHIRSSNLFDFWRGMAPLSALARTLEMDYNEANWLAGYFGEGNAVPTAIISVPPEISDEEFDLVKRDIAEQFGQQRRSAVTRAGDMSVETIQHSVDDMQILDGMGFNAEAIRAVLRVPSGLRDSSSGQSRLAAEAALMRDAVLPMLWNIAEWITLKIMPMYEEGAAQRMTVLTEVPQDEAMAVTKYREYGQDRTINENREAQKLEPLTLTGTLSPLQPLLDAVPLRMVELAFQFITSQSLEGAVEGKAGADVPGLHTTGLQTLDQQMAALTGIGRSFLALNSEEREAAAAYIADAARMGLVETDEAQEQYRAVIESNAVKTLCHVVRRANGAASWSVWRDGEWVETAPVMGTVVVDRDFVRRQGAEG